MGESGLMCQTALSTTIIKTPNEGISFRENGAPAEFQRLLQSMPRQTEVVVAALAGPTPYLDNLYWFYL